MKAYGMPLVGYLLKEASSGRTGTSEGPSDWRGSLVGRRRLA
jgi:hypothetical protein